MEFVVKLNNVELAMYPPLMHNMSLCGIKVYVRAKVFTSFKCTLYLAVEYLWLESG